MEKTLFGRGKIENLQLEYYLIKEAAAGKRTDYGVEVQTSAGEVSCIRSITISRERIERLLSQLAACTVTPAALRDVIDDWLP